jgi:multidrug efflux system outer membrane protein
MSTRKLPIAALSLLLASCTVGPEYKRPAEPVPQAFKEQGPWREAVPQDAVAKGSWWEVFGDPGLNEIEQKARAGNLQLKQAQARVEQARAVAGIADSYFYPTVDLSVNAARVGVSGNRPDQPSKLAGNVAYVTNAYRVPLYASYELDIWGKVRNQSKAATARAEASLAQFYTILLTLEGEVARVYFLLRANDAELVILKSGIASRERGLELVTARQRGGLASKLDVLRAQTEVATTQAEYEGTTRRRADLENALAVLLGQTPEAFSLAMQAIAPVVPPPVPIGLPSDLLQRRPDVAEAERLLMARNAEIGVAKAAYFPSIKLIGGIGYESNDLQTLLNRDSMIWALGASLAQPVFDGGRISANVQRVEAAYKENLAAYQERLLIAFGEVESALAGLRILQLQAEAQARAVDSAEEATRLATVRYKSGLVEFLDVLDAQRTSLQAQRQLVLVQSQQLATTIALIKAIGGGWQERVPLTSKQATQPNS